MPYWYLASDWAELEHLLKTYSYCTIFIVKVYWYYYFRLELLKIKYFLPVLCYWYPASRLAGYQLLKSPAWYKINYMFFMLSLCSPFIIIKNICRHTNRSNLIDNRQVTWQNSIIFKFIWIQIFMRMFIKYASKAV